MNLPENTSPPSFLRYDAPHGSLHACAFKNLDEDTLLVAMEINASASGHVFKWDWRADAYERVGGDRIWGCHDANWAAGRDDALWVTGSVHDECDASRNANVSLVRAADGAVLRAIASGAPGLCEADVNHAQLLDGDAAALFSLRLSHAIVKVGADGARAWTVGGPYGEWPIEDTGRGVTYPPGATVWMYQHNPEYMGEGEVWMFDNQGLGNQSRLLIVRLNETARTARLVWEHRLADLSKIYGDCDPTPAGNVLGSYWRSAYGNASADDQAQAGIVEVSRATREVAWELKVYGRACDRARCAMSIGGHDALRSTAWMMYSVERFYDAPVLPSPGSALGAPTCKREAARDGNATVVLLQFTVFDSFKHNSPKPGAFNLTEDGGARVAAAGTFEFEPHWRPTLVTAVAELRAHSGSTTEVELVVSNARGRATRYEFACVL